MKMSVATPKLFLPHRTVTIGPLCNSLLSQASVGGRIFTCTSLSCSVVKDQKQGWDSTFIIVHLCLVSHELCPIFLFLFFSGSWATQHHPASIPAHTVLSWTALLGGPYWVTFCAGGMMQQALRNPCQTLRGTQLTTHHRELFAL